MSRERTRSFALLLAALVAFLSSTRTLAQGDAPHPPVDPRHIDGSSLGGPIDLSSAWLVKQGDDPRWAAPNWDDSQWMAADINEYVSNADFIWYRTHVQIPLTSRSLDLYFDHFSASHEIYVNGVLMSSCGQLDGGGMWSRNLNLNCPIPDSVLRGQDLTIAIRSKVSISYMDWDRLSIMLGSGSAMSDELSLNNFRNFTVHSVRLAVQILLMLVALSLAVSIRNEPEYFALVFSTAALSLTLATGIWASYHGVQNSLPLNLFESVSNIAYAIATMEFVRLVLKLPRPRLLLGYMGLFAATQIALGIVFGVIPGLSSSAVIFSQIVESPYALGMPILALYVWHKKRSPDALLLSIPLAIQALANYYNFGSNLAYFFHFRWRALPQTIEIIGLRVLVLEIPIFLTPLALLLFIVLRTVRLAREQARTNSELQAARTMQQLLLSRASQPTPGFEVETVYHPAGEVGGDFFLVSPGPEESLVAVVGDVSGKGLAAAMRVSMILGMLRREDSRHPGTILAALNDTLVSESDSGFTTACCVRLDSDGSYTVANAGHISPYVSGHEVFTSPSLPLGLAPSQDYPAVHGKLQPGDRLVLTSDGVVEARTAKGELYGFDRLASLTRKTAHEIADTARTFGQDDDITVLTMALAT